MPVKTDGGVMDHGGGEHYIARDQRCVGGFPQGNIGGVVGCCISSEFQDPDRKQVMCSTCRGTRRER
ncbi:MAG TPA: hypothetical protein VLD40_08530 [Dissulfurispiraceae bacterium]|nr:hypothetical protein [Dissulfurispiraceae bacterium]